MATNHKTIYTHTCDLCGAEHPRGELRRVGLVAIDETTMSTRNPNVNGDTIDVCPACQARPISELITLLDSQPKRDRFGNIIHSDKVRVVLT